MRILIISILFISTVTAKNWPSAIRPIGTDFKEIALLDIKGGYSVTSATQVSYPYGEFSYPKLKVWNSSHDVMEAFSIARDLRFMNWYDTENGLFPRRSTWLYPDDECFARAELIVKNLEERGYTNFYKIFVFGNLEVETDNHPYGSIGWWYHVVPIIFFENDYIVFDPAIDSSGPMLLEDWLKAMNPDIDKLKVAICTAHTVGPYGDDCYKDEEYPTQEILDQQRNYLRQEWYRVKNLGRNPIEELGDNPPWSL